jgi:hypothetical protein
VGCYSCRACAGNSDQNLIDRAVECTATQAVQLGIQVCFAAMQAQQVRKGRTAVTNYSAQKKRQEKKKVFSLSYQWTPPPHSGVAFNVSLCTVIPQPHISPRVNVLVGY